MENLPGNPGKHVAAPSFKNRSVKKASQWTALLVDDHGKVMSFSRVKEAVIISASMLFVAGIAAVIFFLLYNSTLSDNKKLQDTLSASKKKVSTLRNENDILMARLVISESKVDANYADKHESKPKKSLNDYKEKSTSDKDEKAAIVSVNNFNVYYDKDKKILSVQYIIKKTTKNLKNISGFTAIILKNNENNQNEWLILPSEKMIESKPSGKKGQAFLIARFRKIKFEATHQIDPNRFNKATVFVFSKKGELLLEKDFPILIKQLS